MTVTERKQAGDALRESERRHRTLFETMAQGVVCQSSDGEIVSANPAAERILGLSLDQMRGRTSVDPRWRAIHEDGSDFPGEEHASMVALRTGREVHDVVMGVFNPQTDSYRWIEINAVPQFGPDGGEPYEVFTTFDDITERKRAEEEMHHLASFPQLNPVPIVEFNLQAEVLFMNPAMRSAIERWGIDDPRRFIPQDWQQRLSTPDNIQPGTETREVQVAGRVFEERICLIPEFKSLRIYAADITERKQVEEEVRESEARYRSLFENMLEGFAYCRMMFENDQPQDFIYLDVNSRFEELTGLKDVVGKRVTDVIPGIRESYPELFEIYGRVALTGEPEKFETYLDTVGWLSISVYSPGREHFVAVFDNITERKQAEETIARTNRALRAIGESNAVVARATSETELLEKVCGILVDVGGYPFAWVGYAEDDESKTVRPVAWAGFEDGYLSRASITWADTVRGRGPMGTAIRTRTPSVADDYANDPSVAPWREEAVRRGYASSAGVPMILGGRAIGALTVYASQPNVFDSKEVDLLSELASNISFGIASLRARAERDQAAEELARSARRLEDLNVLGRDILAARSAEDIVASAVARVRNLVECLRASVTEFDADGREAVIIAVASDTPTEVGIGARVPFEVLGQPEALRRGRANVVPDTLRVPDPAPAVRLVIAEGVRSYTNVPMVAEGTLMGTLNLSFGHEGEMSAEDMNVAVEVATQLGVTLRQVRLREELERHASELEQRVEERTAALAETNAELDSFASTVAHDLRAPLRGMQGFAQALLEDHADHLPAEGRDFAGRIVAASERMDRLIEDLLAYSRLSRQEMRLRPVPLGPVVSAALGELEGAIKESGAQVRIEEPLPTVVGHRTTLGQVALNLIGNAIKFVAEGVNPQVRVFAEEHGGMVRLWVQDNGIGIAPEHQEQIFRMLERLHGAESYPGTGVGLAIVRKAAERMEGRCGVESEPGRGSRFWLELPTAQESV